MNNEIFLKDSTNDANLPSNFTYQKLNIKWSKAKAKMLSKRNKQFFLMKCIH